MAGTQFVVDVHGLDQLRVRLNSGRLLQPTSKFIHDLAEIGQKTAMRAAKPHPADKGTLGRKIGIDFQDGGKTAVVAPARSIAGIAFTIEEGRRPGKRPPYRAIKTWALSHGILSGMKGESKKLQALREDIKARGTRGIHFMQQAQETVDKAMHQGVPRTEQAIHDLWERPI